jgi:UDP-3-O-[3-hydroxymyristoyl] glucosamine N-acyltransferase
MIYRYNDIVKYIDNNVTIIGDISQVSFDKPDSPEKADENSIIWIKTIGITEKSDLLNTRAKTIICPNDTEIPRFLLAQKCFLLTENPKLLFSIIVNDLFPRPSNLGVHHTALIGNEAEIGSGTYIGPYSVIDRCVIGTNCHIAAHCHIHNEVLIGNNVKIGSSSVIGADGFGFSRNKDGSLVRFPHNGGVIIEDDVEIGSLTTIDKGGLGNTIIRSGVKISSHVHIAHNVIIGKDSMIIANSNLLGSCQIGDRSWIAPAVCVKNGVSIGNDVIVGMGAVVTKNIPDGETWLGMPAMRLEEFLKQKLR